MSAVLNIRTPRVFAPFLRKARYKAAHGGRGSGKSHEFAGDLVEAALLIPEFRAVGIRETQKSIKYSSRQLICDKIQTFNVGYHFEVGEAEIKIHGNKEGRIIFTGMQDHTAESIKSLEGFDLYWCTEAQMLSATSLRYLRPTARTTPRHDERGIEPELWFDWNPRDPNDAVDEFFRGGFGAPANSIVVQANWDSNPFFPRDLDEERREDQFRMSPEEYAHVWNGAYYVDEANQLIAYQWLINARDRGRAGWEPDGSRPRLTVSVDVADGGVDRTVTTARLRYDSYSVLLRQESHHFSAHVAPSLAADAAIDLFERFGGDKRWDDLVVDANGVGSGTAGVLMEKDYRVIPYIGGQGAGSRYRNQRVMCHISMRDELRDGKLIVAPTAFDDNRDWTEFVTQMCMPRRRPGMEKTEDLETKESMVKRTGKSPDRAESLAIGYSLQPPTTHHGTETQTAHFQGGMQGQHHEGGLAA